MTTESRATYRRPLLSPHARTLIYRACKDAGNYWEGTRRGFKMQIKLVRINPRQCAVEWRIRVNGAWQSGMSLTIHDAIDTLERQAIEQTL